MLRDKPDYLRRQPGISPCARFLVGATAMALSAFPGHTLAYRPFTSTDADVVDARELEVEVGYLTVERNAGETGYIAPSVVLNYGLLDTLELVGEFEWHKPPDASWEIANPGIFLKELPKKGVLQGQPCSRLGGDPGFYPELLTPRVKPQG